MIPDAAVEAAARVVVVRMISTSENGWLSVRENSYVVPKEGGAK